MKDKRKYDKLPLGHQYGAGRKSEAHGDKRTKRTRTRKAAKDAALREW